MAKVPFEVSRLLPEDIYNPVLRYAQKISYLKSHFWKNSFLQNISPQKSYKAGKVTYLHYNMISFCH